MNNAHTHRFAALIALVALCLFTWQPSVAHAEDGAEPAPKGKAPATAEKPAKRRPLLWMVEGTPRMFLYGTIHVNDERVTKHLPVVQQALDQSTALYTELAMDPAGLQAMQMAVMQRAPLTGGQTLKDLFGDELYARVEKCMPPMAPLAMLNGMKPWLVMFMLIQTTMSEHQKMVAKEKEAAGEPAPDPNAEALDPMLFNNAKKAGKQVGGLETIDVQIDAFDNISLEKQVEMVKETVQGIEKMRAVAKGEAEADGEDVDSLGAMLELWLAGDDAGFARLFEEDLRKQGKDAEEFVAALLDKRNVGMVKEILRLAAADPKQTYFFAVGAGHMPGPKGIVKLLEEKGHKVRRIELGEKLPALPKAGSAKAKEPAPVGAGG